MSQRTTNAARAHVRAANKRDGAGGGEPTSTASGQTSRRAHGARPGLGARLRYRFDLTLSRGSGALIGWLGLVTLVFVALTGLLLHAAISQGDVDTGHPDSFIENAWQALMRTLDPGTVTGDENWWYRSASLLITIAGIFIFSTLIGLIASVIDRSIESLRKGRGVVPETGHTLILGWSEKLHTIVSELQIANENQRSSCVVVLAPHDRVWMEDELNARRGGDGFSTRGVFGFLIGLLGRGTGSMRVVCRTGNPADPSDLAIVAPLAAKSIIVLTEDGATAPDAQTTKVLLGLMSFDRELAGMHVLAEFTEAENAEALREATSGRVHTIVSSDLIARITAQICRQAGLGAVYQELLDFDGDEVYFHDDANLAGSTWFQLLQAYPASSPIGIRHADGRIELNPPGDHVLAPGDQVIAISEDDDTLVRDALVDHVPTDNGAPGAPPLEPDHLLMVGWNDLSTRMLAHLSRSVPTGSTVDVVVDPSLVTVTTGDLPASDNLAITLSEADTSRLEPLRDVLGMRDYERIVLVGYRQLDPPEADARTLLGLVHARRILDTNHRNHGTSIVAELLEPRSVELGQVANPDDFVVSERLTSLLLAQLSENGELDGVFSELLDGQGVEITMRPLARYLDGHAGSATVPWHELVRSAARLGESAIGTLTPGSDEGLGGVVVNPAKSRDIPVAPDTQVIVVA